MPRRPSRNRRKELLLTESEYHAIALAAERDNQNVAVWARACLLRASVRSDLVVRGVVLRMSKHNAQIVRVLAQCGRLFHHIEQKMPSFNPTMDRVPFESIQNEIADCIKMLGEQP